MNTVRWSVGFLLLGLGACGGGTEAASSSTHSAVSAPVETSTTSTAAPTSTSGTAAPLPTTTTPSTAALPTTTTTSSSSGATIPLSLPVAAIEDFSYGDSPGLNLWDVQGGTTVSTRSIESHGIPMGIVTLVGAGPQMGAAWNAFVSEHHTALAVLVPPAITSPDGQTVAVTNEGVPTWEVIGSELVLSAQDDSHHWAGLWYHDNAVWEVSGNTAAHTYATALINQQATTGAEPEPEQVDIDVLEGDLGKLAVDVPGYLYADAPHANVLQNLATSGVGACADNYSLHSVHPADDPNPTGFDDRDIVLTMTKLSDRDRCNSGQNVLQSTLATPGMEPTQIAGIDAVTNNAHSIIVWVGDNGVTVEADATTAATLDSYRPLLEAVAAATKS